MWSGETGARSCARATRYVIEDLFASVRHSVFIAGYSFDKASDLFAPLFKRAAELVARGEPLPAVHVVLDCSRVKPSGDATPASVARAAAEKFRSTRWTDPDLPARIEYYGPSADRDERGWALWSMHAKCIVVDEEIALVGSANFSTRGRDNRSLEVGASIRDHDFVQSLLAAWADVAGALRDVPESAGALGA